MLWYKNFKICLNQLVPIAQAKARYCIDWFSYGTGTTVSLNQETFRECGLKYEQMFDQKKGGKLFRPTFKISKPYSLAHAQSWIMGRRPLLYFFLFFLIKKK